MASPVGGRGLGRRPGLGLELRRRGLPEDLRALWRESVERSDAILERLLGDGPAALDVTHSAHGGRDHVSLRWILTHMVEEYARHNGHADLLREQIDGQTGE